MSESDIPFGAPECPGVLRTNITPEQLAAATQSLTRPGVQRLLEPSSELEHARIKEKVFTFLPYAGADAYHKDAIRTRSDKWHPELVSKNWLEGTLANAQATGNWAKRLKKAAFGGVADSEFSGSDNVYGAATTYDLSRVPPHVLHSVLGLINEVGEMAEMLRATLSGEKPFDAANYVEEKGDAAWFLFCDCDVAGVSVGGIMRSNIRKLRARYPDKFDAAQFDDKRRDKTAEYAAMYGALQAGELGVVMGAAKPKPTDC
jgi:NTP pyrophosphatase (non-canonical NTP hydrolase)